jgi:uncharacterized protein (TIGR03067 family)
MKTQTRLFSFGLIVVVLATAIGAETEAVKKDLAALQGEWTMVSGTADGQPMPEETRKEMKRICKGDEITVMMGEQVFLKAKITIDSASKPKTIDYQMIEGFTKGKKQFGIYELEGDTFKACFAAPGDERPKDFSSKAGEHRTVSVWKREKADAAKAEK